ncbi:hypothetical protein GCK72_012992 [Caenorhabditis remanei]|uniref:Uncharacterized protein n=1 Tax=Caenorhabditis remanei TaxID=31234 RepID=A0A6A5GPZ1_CAERE|nr:hypothetical protein GCK72_012992 [Caenorhabditis remanei]KAF1756539.1 hypothetical protein GCK72_012992 [Caenorhabditis remanei]
MVLKKERKQKEDELEQSEFPEERSLSPSGMSDEQQNEKNHQLSRRLRGDRNRKHQRGPCGRSQRRGPCGTQVVDGRRSPIKLRARPPTEAPTTNQRGGGGRGGRTNGGRGARRQFGRGRKN